MKGKMLALRVMPTREKLDITLYVQIYSLKNYENKDIKKKL